MHQSVWKRTTQTADVFVDLRQNAGSCCLRSPPGPEEGPHPPPQTRGMRSHPLVTPVLFQLKTSWRYLFSLLFTSFLNVPSLLYTQWTPPWLHRTPTWLKMEPPTLQPAIRSQPPLSDSCWIRWYRRGRWRWRRRAVPGAWSHYEALTCGSYFMARWAVRDAFALQMGLMSETLGCFVSVYQRTGSTHPFKLAVFDLFDLFIFTSFTFSSFGINVSVVNCARSCKRFPKISKINQRPLRRLDCVFINQGLFKRKHWSRPAISLRDCISHESLDLVDALTEKLEELAGFPWGAEPGYTR